MRAYWSTFARPIAFVGWVVIFILAKQSAAALSDTAVIPAQTNVCGTITDSHWTMVSSPYIITCNSSLASGTLTIDPGVVVKFQPGTHLDVSATLLAQGTSSSLINFTSNNATAARGDWGGILFHAGSGNSILRYAIVEYGTGISIDGASPLIDYATIRYNASSGVNLNNSQSTISHSTIFSNTASMGAGINIQGGNVTVDSNTITWNTSSARGGGIRAYYVSGSVTVTGNLISNNTVVNYGGGGILFDSANGLIANNTITDNTDKTNPVGCGGGVNIGGTTRPTVKLQNNTISGNHSGNIGGVCSDAYTTITGNTISGNDGVSTGGLSYFHPSGSSASSIPVTCNTIVNNTGPAGAGNGVYTTVLSPFHQNSIYGNSGYQFQNSGTGSVDATQNYWGTTNASVVAADITGTATYSPFLNAPDSCAAIAGATYSISGQISGDSACTSSIAITDGAGHTTSTDSTGKYSFGNLPAGTYTITPSNGGCVFSPLPASVTLPPSSQGPNFIGTAVYSISGQVTGDNTCVSGVSISDGARDSTATDSNGTYTLTGLPAGNFTLSAAKTGCTFAGQFTQPVTVPPNAVGNNFVANSIKAWTLMFYLDGDNSLNDSTLSIVEQIQSATSNPSVQVVALWKRRYTKNAAYCKITPSDNCKSGANYFPQGNLDMASPMSVVNFVNWARANYPAQHYALILFDHGSGLDGGMIDESYGNDKMTVSEIGAALNSLWLSSTKPIDVLYLDACLMGMIEDAYQFRGTVDFYVASENEKWADSSPYAQYVSGIQTSSTPAQVASLFANRYASVEQSFPTHPYTMSAADLSQLNALVAATNSLAQALNNQMPSAALTLLPIAASVQRFDSDGSEAIGLLDSYIDLYDFARLVKANFSDDTTQAAAQSVMNAVLAYIPPENNHYGRSTTSMNLDRSHGVSIFFPAIGSSFYNANNYDFAVGATWSHTSTLRSRTTQDTISWAPMLVNYFQTTQPGGPDNPNPPVALPQLGLSGSIYLPFIRR